MAGQKARRPPGLIRLPEFDAYLVVDWSGADVPRRGRDSIWYCFRDRRRLVVGNPSTRAQAFAAVRELLLRQVERGYATLVGFDAGYGYPAGFARALGFVEDLPWRSVWNYLQATVRDDDQNRSNRFEVAAAVNRQLSGAAWPFWGCPSARVGPYLRPTRPAWPANAPLSEFRTTELREPRAQSVWKLCYPGSVGSQTLLAIPILQRLRDDEKLRAVSRVWPFETGFELTPRASRAWTVLHAEVYPSLCAVSAEGCCCKDEAQVRTLAEFFRREDDVGRLQSYFAPPAGLTSEQLCSAIAEEGWILGVR